MKIVVLAGGFGTRLQEETGDKPKPMVKIGGRPILWHIMQIYASQGFTEFIIALGYRGEVIKEYFLNYYHLNNDLHVRLRTGQVDVAAKCEEDWAIDLIDTGFHTNSGGRIKRLQDLVGNNTFMLTYGDGVADIDLEKLLECHQEHGKIATITAVRPPARFGGLDIRGGLVEEFVEKPQIGEGWINGGFFVLEPEVLNYIDDDDTSFERATLNRLSHENKLAAYRHGGFWQCMDTLRDVKFLESLWRDGISPWNMKVNNESRA